MKKSTVKIAKMPEISTWIGTMSFYMMQAMSVHPGISAQVMVTGEISQRIYFWQKSMKSVTSEIRQITTFIS